MKVYITRRNTITTHYLLDVDDTLMVSVPEGDDSLKFVFNQELISHLRTMGVKTVSFLTKMDSAESFTSPLRILAIQELEKQGIRVEHVYTPLDGVFRAQDKNFPLGGTYERYLKPIEEAFYSLKQVIKPADFAQLEANRKYTEYDNLMKFFITKGWCKSDETAESLVSNTDELLKKIDEAVLEGNWPKEFDCTMSRPLFFELERFAKMAPKNTVQQFIGESIKHNHRPVEITENAKQLYTAYAENVKNYKIAHFAALTCFRAGFPEKKGEREQFKKGDIYQQWLSENRLSAADKVVFIDDSIREHASLQAVHQQHPEFANELITSLPPVSKGFTTGSSSVELEKFRETIQFPNCASMNEEAIRLAKAGHHTVAIGYFKAAFLMARSPETQDTLFENFMKCRKRLSDDVDPEAVRSEFISINTFLDGFEKQDRATVQLRLLDLEIRRYIYEHANYCTITSQSTYQLRATFFNAISQVIEPDKAFTNVCERIQMINQRYPERQEELVEIVSDFRAKVLPEPLKRALDECYAQAPVNESNNDLVV